MRRILGLTVSLLAFQMQAFAQLVSKTMTGNDIITNLNTLSLKYLLLTNLVVTRHPAEVVSIYENITAAEQSNEKAPQPQTPFTQVIQYGIATASHSLAVEDLRFLITLSDHVSIFSAVEKNKIVGLLDAQLKIVELFDKDDSQFGPDVLGIIKADDELLDASLKSAASVFAA